MPWRKKPEVWAAGLALATGVLLAWLARGLAGDEEAAHYMIARYAPGQPSLFLSLVGRPLVTVLLAVPAQGGLLGARLGAACCTAAAAYALARLARDTGWLGPFWMVALFLVQPFLIAHAATAMTEPLAAALVAGGLLAVVEQRWRLLIVVAALLPLARLETLVFWPMVAWLIWRGGATRLLFLLPLPLLLWNGLGGIPGRDPLWLLHQSSWKVYPERDYLHYVMSYVWIVGLGLFVPVLAGVPAPRWRRGRREGNAAGSSPLAGARRRALAAAWTVVGVFFVVYTALAVWHPITFGNLRYFAYAAPAFAVLAAAGLHSLAGERSWWKLGFLGAALAGAGLLWNHPLAGDFGILTRVDLLPLAVAALWLLFYALPAPFRRAAPALALALGLGGLVKNHRDTLHLVPRPEHRGVEEMATALIQPLPEGVNLYAAHPMLAFFRGENPYDRSAYSPVTDRTVQRAEPGSLLLWDSHYAWRRGRSLEIRKLLQAGGWRYLRGVVTPDSTFAAAYFLRQDPDSTGVADVSPVTAGGGSLDPWAQTAFFIEAGLPPALKGVRLDPGSARAWHLLAVVLARVGRGDEAWKALGEADRLAPRDPYNKAFRAELYRMEGNPEAALGAAREALALDPGNGEFSYLAGMNLLQLGRRAEAGSYLLEAGRKLPNRPDVQYRAAIYLMSQERWREAEPYLLSTLALQPHNARAAVGAAEVAFRLGRTEESLGRLRAFLRDHPSVAFTYLALGDLLVLLERPEEARHLWREALEKTGGDPEIASRLETLGP